MNRRIHTFPRGSVEASSKGTLSTREVIIEKTSRAARSTFTTSRGGEEFGGIYRLLITVMASGKVGSG